MAVYEGYSVYGPYRRKDNRLHVILTHHTSSGSIDDRKTVSYPKYLVEVHLNRYLNPDETVDHIDGDFSNNALSNLRVVPRSLHSRSHTSCREEHIKYCVICGKEFNTSDAWRITCSSAVCRGKCAHVNGYNKGCSFDRDINHFIPLRSLIEEIPSVEDANSGKLLVGNPEQEM